MTSEFVKLWATAYIEVVQDSTNLNSGHPKRWAIEKFMVSMSDAATPDECWACILEVLSRQPPPPIVGILAAGPLEDLIHHCGAEFIERIEEQSRRDEAFRDLLGGVWESSTPEIWSRVRKARGEVW